MIPIPSSPDSESPTRRAQRLALEEALRSSDDHLLQQIVDRRPAAAAVLLPVLEQRALAADEAAAAAVQQALRLADRWWALRQPTLQWRINRLTARLAARFHKGVTDDARWRRLNALRGRPEPARAEAYAAEGATRGDAALLRDGLNIYARILLHRREERWVFAANSGLRAVVPLPDGTAQEHGHPRALVATADGQLYELDLEAAHVTNRHVLPAGDPPRALVADLSAPPHAVALLTEGGRLLLAPAGAGSPLDQLTPVDTVPSDGAGLALLPPAAGRPARLLVGGAAGQILVYEQEAAGGWAARPPLPLEAARINCLTLAAPDAGAPPLLLAGCTLADGRGAVHRLTPDGRRDDVPLKFSSGVLDVQLLPRASGRGYLLAVLGEDGYLSVAGDDGARQWAFFVGSAARNVARFDLDGDGQPEIIVGGPDDTILVLDAGGAIRWLIPTPAPVTHVAAVRSAAGDPLLLVADSDHVLQVVQVNPPGTPQEAVRRQAAGRWLAALARLEGVSPETLVLHWTTDAPTRFLRGYAFYACAMLPGAGHQALLTVDVADAGATVQRAYARALVAAAGSDIPVPAMVARLRRLVAEPATRDQIGLTTMRRLAQLRNLDGDALSRWSPVLQAAAAHPRADVQRAVLYAVRGMQPVADEGTDFHPQVWEILRAVLAAPSDADDWVLRDLAGVVRDLAGTPARLWLLAHAVLAQLPTAGLLTVLGQTDLRLLPDFALPQALGALERLSRAAAAPAAAAELRTIADIVERELPAAAPEGTEAAPAAVLVGIYRVLAAGAHAADPAGWIRFVGGRARPGGLPVLDDYLALLAAAPPFQGTGDVGALQLALRSLQEDLAAFTAAEPGSDQLDALSELLQRRAAALLNGSLEESGVWPGGSSLAGVLRRLLAGLLWHWTQGVLPAWRTAVGRPADPVLTVTTARLRRDQLTVTATLHNPSRGEAIDQLRIPAGVAVVEVEAMQLVCRPDGRTRVEQTKLAPQETLPLRFVATLTTAEQSRWRSSRRRTGTLSLPVAYFRPPDAWPEATLRAPLTVQFSASATLDWLRDLPTAWERVQAAIRQALALGRSDGSLRPLFLTCPPLARAALVDQLQQLSARPDPPPVVDLRQGLRMLRREKGAADEAGWLAWLARRIWPAAAAADVEAIAREGAPHHFFRSLADRRRAERPDLLLLTNWESLLVGLARAPGDRWAPVDRTLPFLLAWAREAGVQLVFVGTHLAASISRRRWPELLDGMQLIDCDRPVDDNVALQRETARAFAHLLEDLNLAAVLARFDPAVTAEELVTLVGGSLHLIDLLVLPALRALLRDPALAPGAAAPYLLDYAAQSNFFTTYWLWQPFYERLVLTLVANGEIPLQERTWAEPGLILSRDYTTRGQDGGARQVVLPAGRALSQRDVVTLHTNRAFSAGDAVVRGLSPHRPGAAEWGAAGDMFLTLLRAARGEDMLQDLVARGLVRQRATRHLGTFYEPGIPLYAAWLRRSGIWPWMLAAAAGEQRSWYPEQLAYDRRPGTDDGRLLFPRLTAGAAGADMPLWDLPALQWLLNSRTLSPFLNFYGFDVRAMDDAPARWQRVVGLAEAVAAWREAAGGAGSRAAAQAVIGAWQGLLSRQPADPAPVDVPDDALPPLMDGAALLPLGDAMGVLHREALLLLADDGAVLARSAAELRAWVRERLEGLTADGALDRTVVFVLALRGADELRRTRFAGDAGPHFVVVDVATLASLATAPDPAAALLAHALDSTGRSRFSPYVVDGSLDDAAALVDRLALVQVALVQRDEVIDFITAVSGGAPDAVQQLCRQLLIRADAVGRSQVGLEDVRAAAAALWPEQGAGG